METKKRRKTAYKRDFGCPLTRNHSNWCYALCEPDEEGRGVCGRPASHAIMGRTQRAILKEKLRDNTDSGVTWTPRNP